MNGMLGLNKEFMCWVLRSLHCLLVCSLQHVEDWLDNQGKALRSQLLPVKWLQGALAASREKCTQCTTFSVGLVPWKRLWHVTPCWCVGACLLQDEDLLLSSFCRSYNCDLMKFKIHDSLRLSIYHWHTTLSALFDADPKAYDYVMYGRRQPE